MKYYVIAYKYSRFRNVINLGDDMQSLAIEDMLKQLSIEEDQLDYIARSEMGVRNPSREKGIFIPATGGLAWNTYPAKEDLPINDYNLRVLYFGTRIPEGMFDAMRHYDAFIASMKKYEPIGCRDVATRDYLRSLGIKAFFTKCVSLGLDYRDKDVKGNKIFIVDIPDNINDIIKESMPSKLLEKTEYLRQKMNAPSSARGQMSDNDALYINQLAKERLDLYKHEAMLVITSRIHVAMPCAAMGIPVIFYDKANNSRSAVVSSVLTPYTKEMIKQFDWNNLKATDISETKRELKLLFNYRLQQEELKMGLKTQRLSEKEFKEAGDLLDLRCREEEPKNTYTPQIFSTTAMVTALLGDKKEEVARLSRPVVLFGAGDLSRRLLVILRRYGINPVCFCDNKISKEETAWHENLPLISFEKLSKNHKNSYVIISTSEAEDQITASEVEDQIRSQLLQHGFNDDYIIDCKDYYSLYFEYLPPPIVYGSDFM
ncbi:MAG: polysaccharide pyruvyl transferase family protein [Flavobacteriales bacterium]|nr:polysaccharide pyruvyl transferase family protein [Flavobacteriales bacterium]